MGMVEQVVEPLAKAEFPTAIIVFLVVSILVAGLPIMWMFKTLLTHVIETKKQATAVNLAVNNVNPGNLTLRQMVEELFHWRMMFKGGSLEDAFKAESFVFNTNDHLKQLDIHIFEIKKTVEKVNERLDAIGCPCKLKGIVPPDHAEMVQCLEKEEK